MAIPSAEPSPIPSSLARTVYGILLAGSLLWCAAIVAAALLEHSGGSSGAAGMLYGFFHPICHQLDGHSLHLAGAKLGVCTRCFSIYLSFLAGLLLYPVIRGLRNTALPHRLVLAAAVLPMLVDVALSLAGCWTSTQVSRALTGSVFGLAAAFFIVPAAVEGVTQLLSGSRFILPVRHHPLEGFSDATET